MQQQPEASRRRLALQFCQVRAETRARAGGLSAEDQCVQSMPDASPAKWHLAHTTWFFEAVVLAPHAPGYEPFDARFFHLFNSYYEALGSRHPRPQRGLLTRPGLEEVHRYASTWKRRCNASSSAPTPTPGRWRLRWSNWGCITSSSTRN